MSYLDVYCERTGSGLWGEPINALTNLAFIVAGVLALRLWRSQPWVTVRNSWDLLILIALLFAIGIGSGLWHTVATPWAMQADTWPILLFINVFLLSFLVRLADCGWLGTIGWFALYHVANYGVKGRFPPDFLNGSIFYGPTWLTLLVITGYLLAKRSAAARGFAIGTAVFTLSLVFRTIDRSVCAAFPLGTHFLWHLCNAVVLYVLLTTMIRGAGTARAHQ